MCLVLYRLSCFRKRAYLRLSILICIHRIIIFQISNWAEYFNGRTHILDLCSRFLQTDLLAEILGGNQSKLWTLNLELIGHLFSNPTWETKPVPWPILIEKVGLKCSKIIGGAKHSWRDSFVVARWNVLKYTRNNYGRNREHIDASKRIWSGPSFGYTAS